MMNNYLVFETQAAAEAALETIYANMINEINSPDLLNIETQEVTPKDELTPAEIVETSANNRSYPIFGVNAATGKTVSHAGYTTAWAAAQKTLQRKWVFPKPTDALMADVANYTVSAYNPDWFPKQEMSK